MLNNGARANLNKMVKSYGVQICNTPKTCEIFLKQQCGEYPEELEVLTKALREGAVGRLIRYKTSQPWEGTAAELTRALVGAGMREDDANWAIDAWAMALGKHPNAPREAEPAPLYPAQGPRLTEEEEIPVGKKLAGQTIVGIGGAAGGAAGIFFAAGILIVLDMTMPTYLPDRWVSREWQEKIQMYRFLALLIFMGMAGICGGIGGFFGWMLGKGEPQAAFKGAIRCFGGAFLAAAICIQFRFAIILVPLFTLIASTGGALSVAFLGDAR